MKRIAIPMIISIAVVSLVFVFFEHLETYFNDLLRGNQEEVNRYVLMSIAILASDIVLPVPSSVVMFMNGAVLGGFKGFVVSFSASIVSALIGYYLGTLSNFKAKAADKRSQQIISKYGNLAIIISRGVPILSESISFTAGYNKVNIKDFILFNSLGYLPVCLIYSLFGSIGYGNNLFLLSFGLSIAVAALIWYFGRSYLNRTNG